MRILMFFFLTVLLYSSCSQKTIPAATVSKDVPAPATKTEPATNTMSAPEVKTLAPLTDQSMIAHGEIVYKSKCGKCHALKNAADYSADAWKPILEKMVINAKLDKTEEEMLRAYVSANAKK
jgi:cytochrome c5